MAVQDKLSPNQTARPEFLGGVRQFIEDLKISPYIHGFLPVFTLRSVTGKNFMTSLCKHESYSM